MNAKKKSIIGRFWVGIIIIITIVALASWAGAGQAGKFALGGGLGFQVGTPDDTPFAVGLYGDYYLTRNFSIGPLLQLGFTKDLYLQGLSAQAKYSFDPTGIPKLTPYVQAGLGFVYASLDRGNRGTESATSFLIPFGGGVEYKLTDSISLDGGVLFNVTNLDVGDKNFFVSFLFGAKYAF